MIDIRQEKSRRNGPKSPRYDLAVESLREPYQRIYEALYKAAYDGAPCPMNRELAKLSGWPGATPRYATQAVQAIETAGLIKVHRGYKSRVVVLPSGQTTHGALEPFKWDVGREDPAFPTAPSVDRTPCPWCGVRGDIGCSHSRRSAA